MSEVLKKAEEKQSLLNEADDMYLGEVENGAGVNRITLNSIGVCGPVITLVTKGIVCNTLPTVPITTVIVKNK